jgi:hypothetical protein
MPDPGSDAGSSQETHRSFAEKAEAGGCHSDRSDAEHQVVEESGLERKGLYNCRPDSSASLGMTDAEPGFRLWLKHPLFSEEWSFVSSRHQPCGGAKARNDTHRFRRYGLPGPSISFRRRTRILRCPPSSRGRKSRPPRSRIRRRLLCPRALPGSRDSARRT